MTKKWIMGGILLISALGILAEQVDDLDYERIYLGSRASLRADGSEFVFEWCDSIWLAPVQGGVAVPLQVTANKDIWPLFAPNGDRVIFQSDRDGGWKLFEITLANGQTRQVSFHSEGARPYGWLQDGQSILAAATRDYGFGYQQSRVFEIPVAQRGVEKLCFNVAANEPSLSPDGKSILFSTDGANLYRKRFRGAAAAQIWRYDLASGAFTLVIRRETSSSTPLWAPDGKGFYYVSGQDGCMNVWHHTFKDGKERQVTFFEEDSVIHPTLSADGRTMVFRHLFDFYRIDPSRSGQKPVKINLRASTMAGRPSQRRRFYTSCWNNDSAGSVAFCDEGMQIAFTTGGDLWVMDTVLRDPKLVHGDSSTQERDCVFDPSGENLYYFSDHGDGVALIRAQRADPEQFWWENEQFKKMTLLHDQVTRSQLSMSPDGARLAWVEPRGTLVIADTNGVVVSRCRESFGINGYDWSPNGKWVVASLSDDYSNYDVWILSADGSEPDYNVSRHFSWDGTPVWSPDGKMIAFVGRRPDSQTDLFYVWLNRLDEEQSTFTKEREKAYEAMRKVRKNAERKQPEGAKVADGEIDFEDLHLRVKRVTLPGITPARPFFSHDSRTVAFEATVNGQAGTYRVVLPDQLQAQLLTRKRGRVLNWLAKDNRLLWVVDNLPAHFEQSFGFRIYQDTDIRDYQELGYLMGWARLRDWYYDDGFHGADWAKIKEKYRLAARFAPTYSIYDRVFSLLQGELNSSHLGFTASNEQTKEWDKRTSFQSWSIETSHLGFKVDPEYQEEGWRIQEILPNTPATQLEAGLEVGDIILTVDGQSVTTRMDPTLVLNGPAGRKVTLGIKSENGQPRQVILPTISYATAREKLREQYFDKCRKYVLNTSSNTLGYLNIQRMQWDDYYRFHQEIFAEGFGKEGMVIDVRDNTGGFVADRILNVLCGNLHSMAVGRGMQPAYLSGYWGYPIWDKPIVVLCNQNTVSNGEIFTHAIKTLKRGKVVGVPTNGGVIATDSATILDLGTLRLPRWGWFLLDGTDMELHGAIPDLEVWNDLNDTVAGRDAQLERAVKVLLEDVENAQRQAQPIELRYAR